ncbi:MAG: hypothetical protein SGI96_02575 [Bacteroidota bacterium]|nr:hypothetical protein [Bacteroidota bacterium]
MFFFFVVTTKTSSSQSTIEWPAAIVEMHYNNTGPDMNEYIEVHFHYSENPFYFPCPCHILSELRFFNQSGLLYKTITPAMMSGFNSGGWGSGYGPHSFGYYQFAPGEDFADEGKVQLINIFNGVTTVMAEYIYNGSGITEQRSSQT